MIHRHDAISDAFWSLGLTPPLRRALDIEPAAEIRELLAGLGLTMVEFDTDTAYRAGELRRIEGGRRLALGDRACLALASNESTIVLTADRDWAHLDAGVEVEPIR